jgi:hypothetical protein
MLVVPEVKKVEKRLVELAVVENIFVVVAFPEMKRLPAIPSCADGVVEPIPT